MMCVFKRVWAVLLCVVVADAVAAPQRGRLITEGHLVAGVQGRVVHDPNEGQWAFFAETDLTDGKGLLSATDGVRLHACSVLEQMAQLAGDDGELEVRLWAMVTAYRGYNYLYSLYFLPMRAAAEPSAQPVEPEQSDEPQRDSVLPTEILQMIERNRAPDLRRLDELVVVSTDRNVIHRTGMIEPLEDGVAFSPDGFGQNVDRRTYRLLPCRTLETMQHGMQTAGRQRYVISGVMTNFDGQRYLLLRRAVRTHTHGNFSP